MQNGVNRIHDRSERRLGNERMTNLRALLWPLRGPGREVATRWDTFGISKASSDPEIIHLDKEVLETYMVSLERLRQFCKPEWRMIPLGC